MTNLPRAHGTTAGNGGYADTRGIRMIPRESHDGAGMGVAAH